MHPQNESPFFALPREIRNKIAIEYLAPSRRDYKHGYLCHSSWGFWLPLVPLVLTCKKMFFEVQPVASSRVYILAYDRRDSYQMGLFSSGPLRWDRIGYLRITLDCKGHSWFLEPGPEEVDHCRRLVDERLSALEEVEIERQDITFKALFRRPLFYGLLRRLSEKPTVRTIRLLGRGPREWPKRYRRLVKPKTAGDTDSSDGRVAGILLL